MKQPTSSAAGHVQLTPIDDDSPVNQPQQDEVMDPVSAPAQGRPPQPTSPGHVQLPPIDEEQTDEVNQSQQDEVMDPVSAPAQGRPPQPVAKPAMGFLEFLESGSDDANVEPEVPEGEGVPEVAYVAFDQEVTVLPDDSRSAARKEEVLEAHNEQQKAKKKVVGGASETVASGAASKRVSQSKRKSDGEGVATSKPKKTKVLKGIKLREPAGGEYKLRDEDAGPVLRSRPGRGKSLASLRRLPGHTPEREKELYDLADSEEGESVTGYYAPIPPASSGPVSMNIPIMPEDEGPFNVSFPNIRNNSNLESEEERAEFLDGILVPARRHNAAMMTNGSFRDFSNEAAIRMLSVQVEYWRRWQVSQNEKGCLSRQNSLLRRQVKRYEDSVKPELIHAQMEELKTEKLMEVQKTQMAEQELAVLRQRFTVLESEKEDWKKKFEDEKEKLKSAMLEVAALEEGKTRDAERLRLLEKEVAVVRDDRKQVIEALPVFVKKLHRSCEFGKEMAKVQRCAIAFGVHKGLEKVKGRSQGLDVTKMTGYNPDAMEQLRVAGSAFEDAEYEFISSLASRPDLSVEGLLQLEPAPYPSRPTAPAAPTASTAPSSGVLPTCIWV